MGRERREDEALSSPSKEVPFPPTALFPGPQSPRQEEVAWERAAPRGFDGESRWRGRDKEEKALVGFHTPSVSPIRRALSPGGVEGGMSLAYSLPPQQVDPEESLEMSEGAAYAVKPLTHPQSGFNSPVRHIDDKTFAVIACAPGVSAYRRK